MVKPDTILEESYHEGFGLEPCPALSIQLARPNETEPFQEVLAVFDTGAPLTAIPIEYKTKGRLKLCGYTNIWLEGQFKEKEPTYLIKVIIHGYVSPSIEIIFWDSNKWYAVIGRNLMKYWHTLLKGPEQTLQISEPPI